MKKLLIPAFALIALATCKEDKHTSFAPTFSGFEAVSVFSADQPLITMKHGDSVQVTAVQETVGDQIYDAKYTWSVEYTNGENGKQRLLGRQVVPNVVYDYDKSNPTIRFRVPDTIGTINISFLAEYQFSSATVNEINSSKGGINVRSSSLMASASGSKRYSVK